MPLLIVTVETVGEGVTLVISFGWLATVIGALARLISAQGMLSW